MLRIRETVYPPLNSRLFFALVKELSRLISPYCCHVKQRVSSAQTPPVEVCMSPYSTVVLAADLTEESTLLAERMKQIVGDSPCAVHIVHVIEPLSSAYGGDVPMDLSPVQDQIQEQAKIHLAEFGLQLGVPQAHQHLIFGRPQSEIQRVAEECEADLIVVGSHTRSGLARLLGSTANGVMDSAPCDVLAVHVGEG